MTTSFKELDKLIDHLRAKGVAAYKAEGIELVLLPSEPSKPVKERKKSIEERLEGNRKGADGLTAEQQEDLYGAVLDAAQG